MARSVSYDALALEVMLAPISEAERSKRLAALRKKAATAIGADDVCPECGASDVGDNGASGSHLVMCCGACGHQWGPGTEV